MQDVLEQRHKLSLERFSKKRDWIDLKISQLEAVVLPAFEDLDGVVEDVQLAAAWKQHDEIDKEANELDQGELRSLRLLAKAASQKHLNAEDTDLIEITLTTLFSLDKLLHLLRQRNKTLRLLDARILWNKQIARVGNDYKNLIQHNLPQFLTKARWRQPEDMPKSKLRDSLTSSPKQTRGSTSSHMARQMRSEIVSLDLASLTSRIHTLLYSTLPATGKTLDTIVDTSPTPIPDRYLDSQDDLEARIKDGIAGVAGFCSLLAKQWREADEIWSIATEETSVTEALQRDVVEAALKVPTEAIASGFETRLAASAAKALALSEVLNSLPQPKHHAYCKDQAQSTAALLAHLTSTYDGLVAKQASARAAVVGYRGAVTALNDAKMLQIDISSAKQRIESLTAETPSTIIGVTCLASTDGPVNAPMLDQLSRVLSQTEQGSVIRAPQVMQALQQFGIDPNIRRDLQDSLLSLASTMTAAKAFLQQQEEANTLRSQILALAKEMQMKNERLQMQSELVKTKIQDRCWRKDRQEDDMASLSSSHLSTDQAGPAQQEIQDRLRILVASNSTAFPLEASNHLQQRAESLLELDRQVTAGQVTLDAVEKQAKAVDTFTRRHASILADADAVLSEMFGLDAADTAISKAEAMSQQYRELVVQATAFAEEVAASTLSVATVGQLESPELASTNARVKDYVNGLVVSLNGRVAECERARQAVRDVESFVQEVGRQKSRRCAIENTLDNTPEGSKSEELARLVHLQSDITAFTEEVGGLRRPASVDVLSEALRIELDALLCDAVHLSQQLAARVQGAIEAAQADILAAEAKKVEDAKQEEAKREAAQYRLQQEAITTQLEDDISEHLERHRASLEAVDALASMAKETDWTGENAIDQPLLADIAARQDKCSHLQSKLSEERKLLHNRTADLLAHDDVHTDLRQRIAGCEAQLASAAAAIAAKVGELDSAMADAASRQAQAETARQISKVAEAVEATAETGHPASGSLSQANDGPDLDQNEEVVAREVSDIEQEEGSERTSAFDSDADQLEDIPLGLKALKEEYTHQVDVSQTVAQDPSLCQGPESEPEAAALRSMGQASEEPMSAVNDAPVPDMHSRQTSEDVFGPEIYTTSPPLDGLPDAATVEEVSTPPSPASPADTHTSQTIAIDILEDLAADIQSINAVHWLDLTASPNSRFPTHNDAQAIQRQISLVHAQLDDVLETLSGKPLPLIYTLQSSLAEKGEQASRVAALADFAELATTCDAAISDLLDALDEQENEVPGHVLEEAERKVQQAKSKASEFKEDARVIRKMLQIEQVWQELKAVIERGETSSPSGSHPRSRSGSFTSQCSNSSRKLSSRPSSTRPPSRIPSVVAPRISSSKAPAGLPVATPRNRKTSTASVASVSSASRLPVRCSPAPSSTFLAPRSVSHKASRDFNRSPGPPTPIDRRSSVQGENLTPPGSRRSSNRRSSGKDFADPSERPNNYRANAKRKLDVAVGNIVNTMNVPVSVTPAEAFQDLTGKYWIGDPPKLYYARILRSKTVMLRVGGGWQELGSFLTTHYDAVFCAHPPPTPLRNSLRDSPSTEADRSWTDGEGLKASLPTYAPSGQFASPRRPDSATPRAVSHNQSFSMRRTFSTSRRSGGPLDLTSLLVKSTSRSPPVGGLNMQGRSKSASIPWRF